MKPSKDGHFRSFEGWPSLACLATSGHQDTLILRRWGFYPRSPKLKPSFAFVYWEGGSSSLKQHFGLYEIQDFRKKCLQVVLVILSLSEYAPRDAASAEHWTIATSTRGVVPNCKGLVIGWRWVDKV